MISRFSRRRFGLACAALAASAAPALAEPTDATKSAETAPARDPAPASIAAQPRATFTAWRQKLNPEQKRRLIVPGMGPRVNKTGDDFEDAKFVYYPQHPKSSWNIDDEVRAPGSSSSNNLWVEGAKRGTPDVVKRIPTPPGGIAGSKGSLMIQTLSSGVPGDLSNEDQQDDLLHNVAGQIGREIPFSWSPNVHCRVYIPPVAQWERKNGATFAFRTGAQGLTPDRDYDEFWPGIFFWMQREKAADGQIKPTIRADVRADEYGRDLPMVIFQPGTWCTLGISMTADGRSHFFAREGVGDLTADDHLGSYMCYNWRGVSFTTFFFNVMNFDNGRSWSTPWVVDNAFLHVGTPPHQSPRMATRP
jgi:hypothetical protein